MPSGLLLGALLAALPAGAAERTLKIESPASVRENKELNVIISASTNAGQGEQVGFLQAEVSVDGGANWTAICYLQKCGPLVEQPATLKPGPAGSALLLRARAAFRDGLAGDVDFTGAAIQWEASWKEWKAPPAKHARIVVTPR